jgi:hypothetical protein
VKLPIVNTKDKMENSLFFFIKDEKFTNKEKISELEEMLILCKSAITILQHKGIISPEWLSRCLDENLSGEEI